MNKQIGGQTDGLICSFCFKIVETEQIIQTRNKKYACEECFDPFDLEQREEIGLELSDDEIGVEEVKKDSNNYQVPHTFVDAKAEIIEKATEINAEEENNKVQIPPELNIIDCPLDVNSDKE